MTAMYYFCAAYNMALWYSNKKGCHKLYNISSLIHYDFTTFSDPKVFHKQNGLIFTKKNPWEENLPSCLLYEFLSASNVNQFICK